MPQAGSGFWYCRVVVRQRGSLLVSGKRSGKTTGLTASSRVPGRAAGDRISAPAYRDGSTRADRHAHLDTDGNPDCFSDRHAHANIHAGTDEHTYSDIHSDSDGDSDRNSHQHTAANCNVDSSAHGNCDSDSIAHSDANSVSGTNVHTGPDTAGRFSDRPRSEPRAGHVRRVEWLNGGGRCSSHGVEHDAEGW